MFVKSCKVFPFIFLLFSTIFFLRGQDLPPIENFSPEDYEAGNQNWAISQSGEKNIYIANHNGLLEYNGAFWKLYPSPNGSIIRSVNVINDVLYTGCYMEIGYWIKNDLGNLIYSSLLNKLETPLLEDEQFWKIVGFDSWVLFQSLDRIYIYNTIDASFTVIESQSSRAKIFVVNNEVYFQKPNEGIYKIEKGAPKLVINHSAFTNTLLVGIFLIDKDLLFLTEKGHFYKLKEKQLRKWNISADKELSDVNVYSSLKLKDGSFILGTISNGMIHLDQSGSIINRINKEKGLNNNTILSLHEDLENNVWLGLDNGISVVNINSPFKVYNDNSGKIGTVYASKIFNNYLYLGTNQGLFYKNISKEEDFKFIENTRGQVWCLKIFDETLFCGHHDGTFVIDQSSAVKIAEVKGTWDIQKIEKKSDILIQGNYTGLNVLEKKNGKWKFKNKIEGIDISSRSFEILNSTELLLNHEYQGIFRLELDAELTEVVNMEQEGQKTSGSAMEKYNNDIFFTSSTDIYKYNLNEHEFLKDSILSDIFFSKEDPISGQLVSDRKKNKLWGFTTKNILSIEPSKFDATPRLTKIPIPSFFRRSLGTAGYETINHLENDTYIIGSTNGYTILDLNKIKPKEHIVKINSVNVAFLHAPKKQLSLVEDIELKSNENNLVFSYSVPEFDKYTEVMYQYKLKGSYEEWSNWSTETKVSLNKLSYGEYIFEVRAQAGNKLSMNEESYSFSIKRPWYLSNLMIVLYAILVGSIFYFIHFFNKRHFKRQQKQLIQKQEQEVVLAKLESEQELMKIKNEQLKNDIKSKNRELTISSMSIIKKNKILNRIKKELVEENDFTKNDRVIKTIDDNINSNKDWKFLEKALNNADKDFFKKIKKIHPKLTPNDLRFCAFLRLNLSSKEIAPLLNISVRSIEIKRYRLRKKMDLPHEGSLIDYILAI